VQGLGFRVQIAGSRVYGVEFKVFTLKYVLFVVWVYGPGSRV